MNLLLFKIAVTALFVFGIYYIFKGLFGVNLAASEFDTDPLFRKKMLLEELKDLNYKRLQAELSGDTESEVKLKERIKELESLIY